MSPVQSQPSFERLGGGLGQAVVAAHHAAALDQDLAVALAIFTSTPGSGGPTVPNL